MIIEVESILLSHLKHPLARSLHKITPCGTHLTCIASLIRNAVGRVRFGSPQEDKEGEEGMMSLGKDDIL